jgi:hypothetical protein
MQRAFTENCPLPRAIGYIAIGGGEFLSENLHVAIGPARVLDAWAHSFPGAHAPMEAAATLNYRLKLPHWRNASADPTCTQTETEQLMDHERGRASTPLHVCSQFIFEARIRAGKLFGCDIVNSSGEESRRRSAVARPM